MEFVSHEAYYKLCCFVQVKLFAALKSTATDYGDQSFYIYYIQKPDNKCVIS